MNISPQKLIVFLTAVFVAVLIIFYFLIFIPSFSLVKTNIQDASEEIPVENFIFKAEFSSSLNEKRTKESFSITPSIKGDIVIKGKEFTFKAAENLNPLERYRIHLTGRSRFLGRKKEVVISFRASKFGETKTDLKPEDLE